MATKHLVNTTDEAVPQSLSGLCCAYPQLEYHMSHKVVLSPDCRNQNDKVAVICGGGSGHEPFAAGFVGTGMIMASVAGSIFASPPARDITHAINCVAENNKAGILMIVPNYTGDRLNFGIAYEKATQVGIKIAQLIVGEDCSIKNNEGSIIGKRGLTGMVVIMKIAGALAQKGLPLNKVLEGAQIALKNMATYAVGLSACSIPGQGLMFELPEDEIECGMGIHGEAGYQRMKLTSAAETVAFMLKHVCETLNLTDDAVCNCAGSSVAVIINNFGALSQLEQGIIIHETVKQLNDVGIRPLRVYSGLLVTSLNSSGIHITLLKLPESYKSMLLECLDANTNAPAWPGCAYSVPLSTSRTSFKEMQKKKAMKVGFKVDKRWERLIKLCLRNACKAIIEKEGHLNELDRGCGDGDCGSTLKRFASGIQENLDEFSLDHPSALLSELADIAEETMGGTSGALYCLFFTAAGKELSEEEENSHSIWQRAFQSGIDCMMKHGKAKIGDRTMLDTMDATSKTYERLSKASPANIYKEIITAAWAGCESTKGIKAKAGRATYVKEEHYIQQVDAGAYAAAVWITTVAETILNYKE